MLAIPKFEGPPGRVEDPDDERQAEHLVELSSSRPNEHE